ncbi:tetratricopeptide repeat protein [Nocardia sp. NBC_01730]|uniref:tetratricopeptide repeat protein n=1 Tax=Nocardia sp. NBC_01730 TaxID=2975998 RepID=UPI002E13EE41|nr:tetratricopeptide repeat protein [Nocardia sp. NBC_01730]
MTRRSDPATTGGVIDGELPTTAGALALANLQAQIDGQQRMALAGGLDVGGRAELFELVALRGHILGCIADYEWAQARAEQLTHDRPADGAALIARARARATFHRFTDALGDLDEARRLGADPAVVDAEHAAILQAVGRYDEALTFMREAVKRRADFASVAALASLCAESGDVATAEHLFDESRDHYRGVSPIPLAQLYFRRAKMWLAQGNLPLGHSWLSAAHRRLPAYAPAQGHLAEVEAALGETDSAIARLHPLTISSDDPDYPAQLARILSEVGRVEEAHEWRARAAARYNELVARHPEAFADHAAEFWLDAGANPHRALRLAKRNLEVRQTPRAHELLARATRAVDGARAGDTR